MQLKFIYLTWFELMHKIKQNLIFGSFHRNFSISHCKNFFTWLKYTYNIMQLNKLYSGQPRIQLLLIAP